MKIPVEYAEMIVELGASISEKIERKEYYYHCCDANEVFEYIDEGTEIEDSEIEVSGEDLEVAKWIMGVTSCQYSKNVNKALYSQKDIDAIVHKIIRKIKESEE